MAPRTVDNYDICEELGQGGMAVVYRARDRRLKRDVALKILHEHIASRQENRERFEREAMAAARLKHPNIVQVYGCSEPAAEIGWLATELVDGPTLRDYVDQTGFALPVVGAMLGLVIADALAHAHERGVIHRDIKPENIMIDGSGAPKIMDFGLARVLDDQRLTMTGSLLGSPAHMSPEMIEGEELRPASDVFALGTVIYFAVTGSLPFDGSNPAVVLNAILGGVYAPASARTPAVDAPLDDIIHRCLARIVDDRYTDASEVRDALDEYLRGLGLVNHRRELSDYFRDPTTYDEALRPRLVEHLEAQGHESAQTGNTARLLRICDRILALDPENRTALGWASSVEAGRRRRRVGGLLAGLAACVTAAVLLLMLPSTEQPAEPEEPTEPALHTETELTPAVDATDALVAAATRTHNATALAHTAAVREDASRRISRSIRTSHDAALSPIRHSLSRLRTEQLQLADRRIIRSREAARAQATPPDNTEEPADVQEENETTEVARVEPPPTGELHFRVWPLTAVILVNGQSLGTAEQLVGPVSLPAGRHHVVARLPELGTQTERHVNVQANRRTEVALVVPWRPARIMVESAATATVFVDGRRAGRSRELIDVAIEGRRPQRTIQVSVYPDDEFGQPWEASITLRTGEERRLDVPF